MGPEGIALPEDVNEQQRLQALLGYRAPVPQAVVAPYQATGTAAGLTLPAVRPSASLQRTMGTQPAQLSSLRQPPSGSVALPEAPAPALAVAPQPYVKLAEQPSLEAVTGPRPVGDIRLPESPTPNFAGTPPRVLLDPNPVNEIEGRRQNQLLADYAKDMEPHHGFFGKIGGYFGGLKRANEELGLEGLLSGTSPAGLRGAQAAEARARVPLIEAETQEATNPQPKPKEESWKELPAEFTGPNGEALEMEANSGQTRPLQSTKATPKKPEGEQPLGNVDNLQKIFTDRYQVLNPGKPLPDEYKLPANATQKDYDRVDKALTSVETAQGTAAQREITNAMREQAAALAAQGKEESATQHAITPVMGTDPATGRTVLTSLADAQKMGLTNLMKAESMDVSKTMSARQWIPLATKEGKTPQTMGILPLIDRLDAEGKLGPLASRWNDFMAGKWGAGDPEYQALKTKISLSKTLLMNLHVGARGGSYLLEEFEDLAKVGRMDAATLRSGVESELDYAQDRAMLPAGGVVSDIVYDDKGVGHRYKGSGDRSDPKNYEVAK